MRIGAATYMELNVPVRIPKPITQANGLMTSPPSSSSASTELNESECVITDRGSVSLMDRLRVS